MRAKPRRRMRPTDYYQQMTAPVYLTPADEDYIYNEWLKTQDGEERMKTRIEKEQLLSILRENRDAHKAIFLEAVEGYRKEAERILKEHLADVTSGKMKQVYVHLPVPEQHTKDYDRVIKMIELNTETVIELTEQEVGQYVMDDWSWKRQFLTSNSTYSGTAAASLPDYE